MSAATPFKVGDRIRHMEGVGSNVPATVTEITERGFAYVYDRVVTIHPRLGMYTTGGETFTDIPEFDLTHWEIIPDTTPSHDYTI